MPGKRYGRHPERALSAVTVRNAKPGRHADGHGLYLEVDESGARRWILRLVIQGRRRDIGLGSAALVTLAEARETALAMRKMARAGRDPVAERRKARAVVPTFEDAARTCHAEHKAGWKNGKHADQWLSTLEAYAFPLLGKLTVDRIGTPEVRDALLPIWLEKPETARRVRQRIGTVLDWATAKGYREGENPTRSVTKGLPRQKDTQEHFYAMPYTDVPGFISKLRTDGDGELSRLAFEFLILTAARTSEVLGARWAEINLEAQTWTVPADRMKAGKAHAVPLAPRAVAILERARQLWSGKGDILFEGRPGKPYSNMVFLMMLRRMEVPATAHGFRSAFRDWAAERTNFPREVAEAALAHAIESKVEAAYRRSDLLDKRRKLMEQWAWHCAGEEGAVVPLARKVAAP
jgi:integrase